MLFLSPSDSSTTRSGDSSDEDNQTLEESPCGRWLKRREEVRQRDIPGIDKAYLAMDSEEGVEVVWNEVLFSKRKNFRHRERKLKHIFDTLMQLDHPNIVKFHTYWIDKHLEKPRVVFITEYMFSGSLEQFLRRTKRNVIKLPSHSWKRWCTQILSALSYLHSCTPPIIHSNLTCDTIFIQHNGLLKIGSVAPEAIHHHVKTVCDDPKNQQYMSPEYASRTKTAVTPAVDIYSFGMCALEMAVLEDLCISGYANEELVRKTIDSLEDPLQKDFICKCLAKNSADRPTAKELLFHSVIFEVPTLKLICTHVIIKTAVYQPDQLPDEGLFDQKNVENDIVAFVPIKGGKKGPQKLKDKRNKLEVQKLVDDVRTGIYPLTAYASFYEEHPPLVRSKSKSPDEENRPLLYSTSKSPDEENRPLLYSTSVT